MTVKEFADYLNILVENNCGDYNIKCIDKEPSMDEVGVNHIEKSVILRGYLYSSVAAYKVAKLNRDIEKAIEEFYK